MSKMRPVHSDPDLAMSASLEGSDEPKLPPPDIDDLPWEPGPDFGHVFIRVNEANECVISGPPDQVAEVRRQIVDLLLEGAKDQIPDSVMTFEIH
jgi:hypothetical protein